MLVLTLIFFAFVSFSASANKDELYSTNESEETAFGDAVFEAAVIVKMKELDSELDITSIDITDEDQLSLIARLGYLEIGDNTEVTSFKGIEYLTALSTLKCYRNENLTELDLSANINLKKLACNGSSISELDLSANKALTYVNCTSNDMTSLVLPDSVLLTELYVYDNQFTSLDVSNNTGLEKFTCYQNNLTTLILPNTSSLTTFECQENELTSLDISNNAGLIDFKCDNNHLTSLDFSNATTTTDYNLICGAQTSLDGESQNITLTLTADQKVFWNVDLINDSANTGVVFESEDTDSEDADSEGTAFEDAVFEAAVIVKMKELDSELDITSIDVTNEDQLLLLARLGYLEIGDNTEVTSFKGIEYLTALSTLKCYRNENLTELDLSANINLKKLACNGSSISELDLSANKALTYVNCTSNDMTSLVLPDSVLLTELYVYDNQFTSLDVSNNTGLEKFTCYQNNLTTLILPNTSSLTTFECQENELTSLDISNNAGLIDFKCDNNHLTSLDFSNATTTTDYNLICGAQTSLDGESQNITLTLTADQKVFWNVDLINDSANTGVVIEDASTIVVVTEVTLDQSSVSIEEEATVQLVATISPVNATNVIVVWSSSDEAIATVDENGLVTAVASGNATITVTTDDGGFTATTDVSITYKTGVSTQEVTSFKAFPSPASTVINLNNIVVGSEISLISFTGKEVIKTTAISENEIVNVSAIKAGMYVLKVNNETQVMIIQ
jgi:uncharacterized protein YjdB